MTFFNPLYRALADIGYLDPLHPPFSHFPIGLVTASLIFGLVALIWRRPRFWITARHCLWLAWLFVFPTVLFGFMDWQHYYHGAWMLLIVIKICLASFLFVLLTIGLILQYKGWGESKLILVIYLLGFFAVVGLGYCGGKVVFEGPSSAGAAGASLEVKAGEKIYAQNCRACHPGGKNVIMPNHPIIGSDRLSTFPVFRDWIRNPRLPDGGKGAMPAFSPGKISTEQARELYRYVLSAFGQAPLAKPHH
jgi:mono/diheme cytochrome c family protein